MTYSIEQLKGEIGRGGGIARGNLYRVILPVIPEIYLNLTGVDFLPSISTLNVLCKNVNMPGRQLMTLDRTVGVVTQKVAYGFANEDVNMTFLGMNDYVARKYFEAWMEYAMNNDTHEVKYKTEYAKRVTIQQLDKQHRVVYGVDLEQAFPTQILNVDFGNENTGPVDIGITLTYTKWKHTNIVRDAISTEAQKFLENLRK